VNFVDFDHKCWQNSSGGLVEPSIDFPARLGSSFASGLVKDILLSSTCPGLKVALERDGLDGTNDCHAADQLGMLFVLMRLQADPMVLQESSCYSYSYESYRQFLS
jgi:hypothetical protein